MALVTRFSMEELARLHSLPKIEAPSERRYFLPEYEAGWCSLRPLDRVWDTWSECLHRGCEVYGHVDEETGTTYIAHNEALAAFPEHSALPPTREMEAWLKALHSHEAAVR